MLVDNDQVWKISYRSYDWANNWSIC